MKSAVLQNAVFVLFITAASAARNPSQQTSDYFGGWDTYAKLLDIFDSADKFMEHKLIKEIGVDFKEAAKPVGIEFPCDPSKSPVIPTSVNELRPGDINVIAAMGDSLTAANGALATTVGEVMRNEYRGVSAPVGGDKDLRSVVTLANILKQFNPGLYGYSICIGGVSSPNSGLNVAIPGAYSSNMSSQAEELVSRLKSDSNVDYNNDWKLVTLFVGANDLCQFCYPSHMFTPEGYVKNIEEAIEILSEVPRTFVNVVGVLQVVNVAEMNKGICLFLHMAMCSCAFYFRDEMIEHTNQYQSLLQESITSGQFDRDDFATVYQPYFVDTVPPRLPDGSIDYSYFAPDCFHFSVKGQSEQAVATWNNMLQPVGSKDTEWSPGSGISCPDRFPYLYTNANSRPGQKSAPKTGRTFKREL